MAIHGYAATEGQQIFERAHELIDETTPDAERLTILCGLWNVRFGRSDLRAARLIAEEMLRAAEASGNGILLANCTMGQMLSNMGEFREAKRHLQFVIDAYEDMRRKGDDFTFGVDELVLALAYMSPVHWALGEPMEAARVAKEAADRAHEGKNSVTTAAALTAYLFVATHSRSLEEAEALAEQAIAFCQENDLQLFEYWLRFHQGTMLAKQGHLAEGIETMQAAIAQCERLQSRTFRPFQGACLARAYLKLGDVERALAEVDGAIAMADITAERQSEVGIRRLRYEILKGLGRKDEAEAELERTLALAKQQGTLAELGRLAEAARGGPPDLRLAASK